MLEIDGDLTSVDTEILELVLSLMKFVCRVKEGLGWNAADIETGTTEGASLFNADGFESTLASLDSCDIAAWATANDSDIVLLH